MISSVIESCGQMRLRMVAGSEKRTPWWNQDVKKAIRTKKDAFKVFWQNRSSSDLQSWYSEAQKAAAQAVKMSKERFWKEFGRFFWIPNIQRQTQYLGRPFADREGKV